MSEATTTHNQRQGPPGQGQRQEGQPARPQGRLDARHHLRPQAGPRGGAAAHAANSNSALRKGAHVLTINLDGGTEQVLVKEVQYDHLSTEHDPRRPGPRRSERARQGQRPDRPARHAQGCDRRRRPRAGPGRDGSRVRGDPDPRETPRQRGGSRRRAGPAHQGCAPARWRDHRHGRPRHGRLPLPRPRRGAGGRGCRRGEAGTEPEVITRGKAEEEGEEAWPPVGAGRPWPAACEPCQRADCGRKWKWPRFDA